MLNLKGLDGERMNAGAVYLAGTVILKRRSIEREKGDRTSKAGYGTTDGNTAGNPHARHRRRRP